MFKTQYQHVSKEGLTCRSYFLPPPLGLGGANMVMSMLFVNAGVWALNALYKAHIYKIEPCCL